MPKRRFGEIFSQAVIGSHKLSNESISRGHARKSGDTTGDPRMQPQHIYNKIYSS
jgi:hypothetical protein